jgi:hypothetical protein
VLEKGNKCIAVSGSGEQVSDNLQNSSLHRKCGDCHLSSGCPFDFLIGFLFYS